MFYCYTLVLTWHSIDSMQVGAIKIHNSNQNYHEKTENAIGPHTNV